MRTCVELRGSISVAHNPSFSPSWARVHGHDYLVVVGICVDEYAELVVDAAEASRKLTELLAKMDGRYLASGAERHSFREDEVYVVPCSLPGVSGECLAKHIADLVGASWVRVCESSLNGPCFYYEK